PRRAVCRPGHTLSAIAHLYRFIWVFKEPFLIFNIIIRVLDAYGQKRMFNDVPFACWPSGFFKV
ncbi:hypothetical protein, partial [Pseudomonas amygdali]|uniref:hypothetical protein n=1 Tax=Pseudomonas amygdali TaxID=47877 RepID=UPI001C7EEB99